VFFILFSLSSHSVKKATECFSSLCFVVDRSNPTACCGNSDISDTLEVLGQSHFFLNDKKSVYQQCIVYEQIVF